MPRTPRFLFGGGRYHIMTRGNNKHQIFRESEDYRFYLSLVETYKQHFPFELFHYCLMPNHVHFLVELIEPDDFINFMKSINLAYAHYYRHRYGWVGYFWQDRYKSQLVGNDRYFVHCGKYIELNPVRAGLVSRAEQYKYSSYRVYLGLTGSDDLVSRLVTLDPYFLELGSTAFERSMVYRQLIVDEQIRSSYSKTIWASKKQHILLTKKIQYQKRDELAAVSLVSSVASGTQ